MIIIMTVSLLSHVISVMKSRIQDGKHSLKIVLKIVATAPQAELKDDENTRTFVI